MVNEQSNDKCPSEMALDAYRLGISGDADRIDTHMTHCEACSKRWDAMNAQDTYFGETVLAKTREQVIARVQSDAEQELSASKKRRSVYRIALAVAAALLLSMGAGLFWAQREPAEPYIGIKGDVGLTIWCRRGEAVFRVNGGDSLQREDMLRFVPRFNDEASRYVMVVSVDESGGISQYYPHQSDVAAQTTLSEQPLPGSTVLDDAKGAERIWLLVGDEPFHFDTVAEALDDAWHLSGSTEKMGSISLALQTSSVLLFKR